MARSRPARPSVVARAAAVAAAIIALRLGTAGPSARSIPEPGATAGAVRDAVAVQPGQAIRSIDANPPVDAAGRPLPDAETFLNEAERTLRSNDSLRSAYRYVERETRFRRDRDGRAVPERVRIYEVTGSPEPELVYRRLVSDNGTRPRDLDERDAEQRRKEQDWYGASAADAARAREARERRAAEAARAEREVIAELRSTFDIRMTGREDVDGRPAITFRFDPRPGAKPSTKLGRILLNFHGKAWLDEQEHELVRMTSEALDTVSVRWGFIVRLLRGSRGVIERRKIDDDRWLPTYSRFTGSARVFFVWRIDVDQATEFSDYRRIDGP